MKAVQWMGIDKLELVDVQKPVPGPGDVLIRVEAASICGTDIHIVRKGFPGVEPPVTLGHEFSGVVAELGPGVEGIAVGERVTAEPFYPCGECHWCRIGAYNHCSDLGAHGFYIDGGMAEYVVASGERVFRLPPDVSFEEGAVVEPATNCVYSVDRVGLREGESVLVMGDGFAGLVFVQLARRLNAKPIVMVGHHDNRLEIAKAMGADLVVNNKREDPTDGVSSLTNGMGADLVIEAAGSRSSFLLAMQLVRNQGRILQFGVPEGEVSVDLSPILMKELTIVGSRASPGAWQETVELVVSRQIDVRPMISQVFALNDTLRAFETAERRLDDSIKVFLKPSLRG